MIGRPCIAGFVALLLAGTAAGQGTTLQAKRGISTGAYHTCSVINGGAVSCWGWNDGGALGIGSSIDHSLVPLPVPALTSGVVTVASNYSHSCALLVAGTVRCWGRNSDGQLGDGTKTARSSPVGVKKLPAVAGLGVGKDRTCAFTAAGSVYCWAG